MKKIAIYAAVGYGFYYFLSKGKAAYNTYINLQTKVVAVRKVKPGLINSTMEIDVMVKNTGTTPIDISTGGLITLKKVNLYSAAGTLIGFSTPGTTSLNIPAGGNQIIKNVPTVIKTSYVLEALGDLNNVTNVKTTIEIEAGGHTITI